MDTHRKILRAIVTVGAFVLLARVVGALREVLFAARFGTSEIVDAYVLTSSIVYWPAAVWMSTLTAVAVPILVKSDAETPNATAKFVGDLATVSVAVGLALSVPTFVALWYLAGAQGLNLSPGITGAMRGMLAPLCLTLPLALLVAVLSVRLMSQQRHINTLLDGIPALLVAVALLLVVPLEPVELAWATVAGFVVQVVVLTRLQGRNVATFATPRSFETLQWRALKNGLAYFMMGQLAVGAITFVDPIMVAGEGSGSVAAFGYANRVLALALGLTATAVARAMLPTFAELAGDEKLLVRTARSWITWLLAVGIIGVAVGWLAAPWVIKALFERGQFSAADTEAVATILRYGLVQLPFYLSGIVAVQLLAAQGRHREITKSGLINLTVKLVANVPMIAAFGVTSAMLVTALMYCISSIVLVHSAFRGRVPPARLSS